MSDYLNSTADSVENTKVLQKGIVATEEQIQTLNGKIESMLTTIGIMQAEAATEAPNQRKLEACMEMIHSMTKKD